jgi:hypothetical protein
MTLLGRILAILNVVAAVIFFALLAMDYGQRQAWSFAIFRLDLQLQGFPLETDNLDPSVPHERVLSQHLDEQTLKLAFSGVGEPVKTLEEEVQKLQGRFLDEINAAVGEVSAKFGNTDGEKKKGLRFVLLPLARTGPQVVALNAKIEDKRIAGPALDTLVQEAVRRYLLNDLLDPLQQLSPADVKDDLTPRIAELNPNGEFAVSKEDLDKFVDARFSQIRDPNFVGGEQPVKWDRETRRQIVAGLIFAVEHLTKPQPDGKLSTELLFNDGPGRAQVVLGLIDYNVATDRYAEALDKITHRITRAIEYDRDGIRAVWPGFVGMYREQVAVMRRLAEDVKDRQRRLDDLRAERKKVEDDLTERKAHQDAIVKKITDSRAETLRLAKQLQHMQQQLFVAQREIATAQEDNVRLLQQIRELEGLTTKGAR